MLMSSSLKYALGLCAAIGLLAGCNSGGTTNSSLPVSPSNTESVDAASAGPQPTSRINQVNAFLQSHDLAQPMAFSGPDGKQCRGQRIEMRAPPALLCWTCLRRWRLRTAAVPEPTVWRILSSLLSWVSDAFQDLIELFASLVHPATAGDDPLRFRLSAWNHRAAGVFWRSELLKSGFVQAGGAYASRADRARRAKERPDDPARGDPRTASR